MTFFDANGTEIRVGDRLRSLRSEALGDPDYFVEVEQIEPGIRVVCSHILDGTGKLLFGVLEFDNHWVVEEKPETT